MAGLVPNSWGSLREYNDCHNPAGSPEGGRFCSTGRAAEEHSPWSRRENELWAKRRLLPELERARKTGNATHVKVLTRRLKVLGLTHLDRRARESNDCHLPAGSPEGGQFCGTDSPTPSSKKMEGSMVRLTFNGQLTKGELIRATGSRLLVRYTSSTGRTREVWVTKVPKPDPGKPVIGPRTASKLIEKEFKLVSKTDREPPRGDAWNEWVRRVRAEAYRRLSERFTILDAATGFVDG